LARVSPATRAIENQSTEAVPAVGRTGRLDVVGTDARRSEKPNDLTSADRMSRRAGQTTLAAENSGETLTPEGRRSESTSWQQVGRALYLPQELMGFAEGSGLLWLAGMANGSASSAPFFLAGADSRRRRRRDRLLYVGAPRSMGPIHVGTILVDARDGLSMAAVHVRSVRGRAVHRGPSFP
jgi:Type IV secretory system Conjugative DNA transfer